MSAEVTQTPPEALSASHARLTVNHKKVESDMVASHTYTSYDHICTQLLTILGIIVHTNVHN